MTVLLSLSMPGAAGCRSGCEASWRGIDENTTTAGARQEQEPKMPTSQSRSALSKHRSPGALLRCAGLFACVVSLLSPCSGFAAQDAGASYNLLLKAPLQGEWFVLSRSNLATRNNFSDRFLGYVGFSIGRQMTDQLSLRVGYRRAWFRFTEDWQPEDRAMLEGYFADRFGGFRITNRLRAEFRYFDWRDDDIRLRNEITVEAPWSLTPLKLKPYLEEEFFYSTNAGRFEANWLGGGLAWRPKDGVKLKLGYRWNRFRAGDDWANRNVLVAGVNLFF
jgi:hypothetical protein